jgi:hypothetical protein
LLEEHEKPAIAKGSRIKTILRNLFLTSISPYIFPARVRKRDDSLDALLITAA